MTDSALENAEMQRKQLLERKKALMAEMIEIDEQIGFINRWIKGWHSFAELGTAGTGNFFVIGALADQNKPTPVYTPKNVKPKNSDRESVANLAMEIIRERQEPVSRSDLYKELTARGMVIKGKDDEMVLSTMLWRSRDRIVRLKSGGYWLKGIPNALAGYDPETATDLEDILNTPASEILDPESEEYRDASENAG